MSDTAGRPNTLPYHKPNCQCPPCKRKKEAESGGTRGRGRDLEAEARVPELSSTQPEAFITAEGVPVLLDDRSFRARVLQIAALKAHGLNLKQIAEKLDLSHGTVRTIVYKANRMNLLQYEDPYERFEQSIVPKVVDNINYWIDQKDKKMTIEAAKGAGLFKAHQAIKVEGETPQTVLALKIEMPPGTEPTKVSGRVVGKPRRIVDIPES